MPSAQTYFSISFLDEGSVSNGHSVLISQPHRAQSSPHLPLAQTMSQVGSSASRSAMLAADKYP